MIVFINSPVYLVEVLPPPPVPPPSIIAKMVMGDALPARDEDYSGDRLDPAKSEQLYEKMRRMRLRGVENKALLSRTLGVNYKTIASWCLKFENEMRRDENDRSDIVERNKMVLKLEEIQQTLWQLYADENTSTVTKIAALRAAMEAISQQAQLLGLHGMIVSQHHSIAYVDPAQVTEARELAFKMKALLAKNIV